MKNLLYAILPLALLSGCATPESRVRSALIEAGLAPPVAGCMARRMVDRLSLAQLQKLSRLSGLSRDRLDQLSIAEFTRRVAAIGDPEIISVTGRAAIGCTLSL